MQNKTFTSSLQRSTHFLPVGGDVRQLYTLWTTPGSGSGYSYLKCEVVSNSTKVEFDITNIGDKNAVAAFSAALIKQDADLYAKPIDNPNVTPPVWTTPPIGTGGVVTVVPGGSPANLEWTTNTFKDGGQDTLVVRVQLTGAPIKVEAWTPGTCELY